METLNFKAASARWHKILARFLDILIEVFLQNFVKIGLSNPLNINRNNNRYIFVDFY